MCASISSGAKRASNNATKAKESLSRVANKLRRSSPCAAKHSKVCVCARRFFPSCQIRYIGIDPECISYFGWKGGEGMERTILSCVVKCVVMTLCSIFGFRTCLQRLARLVLCSTKQHIFVARPADMCFMLGFVFCFCRRTSKAARKPSGRVSCQDPSTGT